MSKAPTIFLQIVVVLIGIAALVFLIWEPRVEGVNANATNFEMYTDPFILLVYAGSIPFFMGLYQAFKLIGHVREDKVFTLESAKALRAIKYCALTVIGFVALEELFIMLNHGNDDAAGAVMLGILITFSSIVVAVSASLFEKLLHRAMAMKATRSAEPGKGQPQSGRNLNRSAQLAGQNPPSENRLTIVSRRQVSRAYQALTCPAHRDF